MNPVQEVVRAQEVVVPVGVLGLRGRLTIPARPSGVVLLTEGTGSGRHARLDELVGRVLHDAGMATLRVELLTPEETQADERTAQLRFDIPLMGERLVGSTDWLAVRPEFRGLPLGYFGVSTGAGAAMLAAALRPEIVTAVVSAGGRPDLAVGLGLVRAPTLLIVGGDDTPVMSMNRLAMSQMMAEARLEIVSSAGHLFDAPGQMERVAALARGWFLRHLAAAPR